MMRDAEGWSHNYSHKHTHTKPLSAEGEFCFWAHFSPRRLYLKIALKSDFFDFFQTICFWKAETELEINLLEFLGSEVI